MAELLSKAEAEGFGGLKPEGSYALSIKAVKAEHKQNGKRSIGIQWQILSGPATGSFWSNLNLSPENGKALAIFFRELAALGVDQAFIVQLPSEDLEPVAARIRALSQGVTYTTKVTIWGAKPDGTGGNNSVSVVSASAIGQPGIPAQPVMQAVAQPVQAPVQYAQPAPVPQPVQVVAPQPVYASQPAVAQPVPQPVVEYAPQPAVVAAPVPQPAAPVAVAPVAYVPPVDPMTGLPPRPDGSPL